MIGNLDTHDMHARFGAPNILIRRSDLQDALHRMASDLNAKIELNSRIVDYRLKENALILENGDDHVYDVIVAADGMYSPLMLDAPTLSGTLSEPSSKTTP